MRTPNRPARNLLALNVCLVLAPTLLSAQTTFDTAEIHVRPPNFIRSMRTSFVSGHYELRNATLVNLIATAWNIQPDKIQGGPEWLDTSRFDVSATTQPGITPEARRLMLQTLLKDRFSLTTHRGAKDFPAFILTAGPKPTLQPAAATDPENSGCTLISPVNPKQPRGENGAPVAFACHSITMAKFTEALPTLRGAPAYLFDYLVTDRTGLTGSWNFNLNWSMRVLSARAATPVTDPLTLFDAIDRQLGLKLRLSTIPTPVLVVDNAKPVAQSLPASTPEFEVAEIKPQSPADIPKGSSVRIDRGGLVNIKMSLRGLLIESLGEMNPDLIQGGPKFMDSEFFEVVAKMPPDNLAAGSAVFNGQDIDSMRLMLGTLLKDRFKLTAHKEDRPVPSFSLAAARPKLHQADPSNRPGCTEGPGADAKDPRLANPVLARLLTCRNMTMPQFAAALANAGYYYFAPPILDETGLKGRYDMTLSFSPRALAEVVEPEPNGAVSLSEALEKQLGLKLQPRKVNAPALVIDHIEQTPVAN